MEAFSAFIREDLKKSKRKRIWSCSRTEIVANLILVPCKISENN